MKVKDLMALLFQCEPEAEAYVWDAAADWDSKAIRVSVDNDGKVSVGVSIFGQEVTSGLTPEIVGAKRSAD